MRRAQAFQPSPCRCCRGWWMYHTKRDNAAKFTLWSHWQTAPCSSCSASHVSALQPLLEPIEGLHPAHSGTSAVPSPEQQTPGTVLTASSLPEHSSHLIAFPTEMGRHHHLAQGLPYSTMASAAYQRRPRTKMHAAPTMATAP